MVGNRRRRWRKMVQFEYDYADCRRQALIFGVVRPFHCSKFQVSRVLPDGCSSRRDQSTARAPPWPTCAPLSEGKLSTDLDAQVLIPRLSETPRRAQQYAGYMLRHFGRAGTERIFGPEHVKRHPDGSTEYIDIPESKFRELDQRVLHRATCGTLNDHDDHYQMIYGAASMALTPGSSPKRALASRLSMVRPV